MLSRIVIPMGFIFLLSCSSKEQRSQTDQSMPPIWAMGWHWQVQLSTWEWNHGMIPGKEWLLKRQMILYKNKPLYRTGVSVGDYPVDHHHECNPDAPKINFPKIPSYRWIEFILQQSEHFAR